MEKAQGLAIAVCLDTRGLEGQEEGLALLLEPRGR